MKKIITLITMLLSTMSMQATDYSGYLTVNVNGQNTYQKSTISLDKQDNGKYTLSLKNFILAGDNPMYVGNIIIDDTDAQDMGGGAVKLNVQRNICIQNGDDENVFWSGPYLGEVPVDITAYILPDGQFATTIDINMAGMTIAVNFSTYETQIKNSDFEAFHEVSFTSGKSSTTGNEPDYWHSFLSADGKMAVMAQLAGIHTFISEDETRPGSSGTKSLLLKSGGLMGIVANGTVTTGRISAGSTQAADKSNHSYINTALIENDSQGNPFYSTIGAAPDSIKVWVKFKQNKTVENYPYATVSAILTDGTYYQDPEDVTYTNVFAKAANTQIESKDFVWQEITIPFDYSYSNSYNGTGNTSNMAVLITISTNADAGKGTTSDVLYVDDLSLIYNNGAKAIKFKGNDIALNEQGEGTITNPGTFSANDLTIETNGRGAKSFVTLNQETTDGKTTYYYNAFVISGDMKTSAMYRINVSGGTPDTSTNIKNNNYKTGVAAIYNIGGHKVDSMTAHGVYIVKYTDGTSVKVVK